MVLKKNASAHKLYTISTYRFIYLAADASFFFWLILRVSDISKLNSQKALTCMLPMWTNIISNTLSSIRNISEQIYGDVKYFIRR